MKRLLMLVFVLTLFLSLSVFAAENGENVYVKVWDSTGDDVPEGLWEIESMGDMDGDGLKEFAVNTDESGSGIYLYECSGNNDYTLVWSYIIPESESNDCYGISKGDLDGDGLEEIIVATACSDTLTQFSIHIFEWDGVEGSDTYTLKCLYNVNETYSRGSSVDFCEVGDFDGDGVQEMFLGETIYDDLFIVSLDTTSDFEFPSWIIEFEDRLDDAGGDYSPWGFVSGDFDADGLTELATTEWDYNALIVIQVDDVDTYSRELWWNDMTYPSDGCALRSLCAADLDGNGFTEIILPSTNGTVYTITNTGTFVDLNLNADAVDSITTVSDMVGCAWGDQDMYLGSRGEPDLYIAGDYEIFDLEYVGGDGDYTDGANWDLYEIAADVDSVFDWQDCIVGDFDSDGLKDIVYVKVTHDTPFHIEVYEHEPLQAGTFVQGAAVDSVGGAYQTRCVAAGSDLDQDGKKEVFITDYRFGGVIQGFEVIADNTLEWIWTSDSLHPGYWAANRNVTTGDLDNDGIGEVICTVRGNAGDELVEGQYPGLNIFEWDGTTDNGFNIHAHTVIDDSLTTDRWRFEPQSAPFDVDGDGDNEILIANSGALDKNDRFYIASVDGTFESGFWSLDIEASWNAEDDGFQYSPWHGAWGDLDGDGTYEIVFHNWDMGNINIIDVTGADTYELVNQFQTSDIDFCAYGGFTLADFDGDGRDEMMGDYYGIYSTMVINIDGDLADATMANSVAMVRPNYGGGGWYGDAADFDGDGKYEYYCCDYGTHAYELDLVGTNVLNQSDWAVKSVDSHLLNDDSFGFFSLDATDDTDGDGKPEIFFGFLESFDSDPQIWLKVMEYTGGTYVDEGWKIITPDNYKLSQNFPNPFNPTTQISFELPLDKDVSLKIFDMLGHEVATLVNEHKQAGSYTITWDGKNSAGMSVSTGNYIYRLKAGHVVKSMTMTLVK